MNALFSIIIPINVSFFLSISILYANTNTEYLGSVNTGEEEEGYNSDAIKCVGSYLNFSVPDILIDPGPPTPFISW